MQQRDIRLLILIVVVAAVAIWVSLPSNPGIHLQLGDKSITRDIRVHQGLDLQGGMQVLLEADVPEDQAVDAESMAAARKIVESRVNGLGVTEPVVQGIGNRRILVELPGIEDPEQAIANLRETGLMEWVDTGAQFLPPGTVVTTDMATSAEAGETVTDTETVYHTVLTGKNLRNAQVEFDPTGFPVIAFELDDEGARIFAEHTANNIGRYLAIALDKTIISCPRIDGAIPEGRGQITGNFTVDEAKATVLQLRYGALPIPLKVIDTRAVGPTLGQDSVQRSIRAGTIGIIVVLLFMLVYYRLPGLLADLALLIYAVLTLALFKLIPVTLTLPGIAGFLLSVGMAVDANILIFERMREELRHGRTLGRAVEAGFRRAWTSILDSNVSTWITCAILFLFGNSFGASMVKGFALTLALGVLVSMFTAVVVTRTFMRATVAIAGDSLRDKKWLLGI
ncbi:MAG TPA: protein translocase subunit SecD [Chloroflexi bacterium]|jgi:protein-export membrane protein SecD|nr:protein translocase subunit SecD [Chloroflexota bacterium]